MDQYPDCKTCWWAIEPDGAGWKHITDRAELAPDEWMCNTPEPEMAQ